MMKTQRQELILSLISENVIETQEQLRLALSDRGVNVTQATLSRDISELSLVKTADGSGRVRYAVLRLRNKIAAGGDSTLLTFLSASVVSVDHAMNTVVVKCHTGMAQAVCAKIDSTDIENVVGTIAGDDTIFILMRTPKDADRLAEELRSIIAGA